ncbi:MAG TPA: hypothetical protein VIP98_00470 [Microlunatus sp.]
MSIMRPDWQQGYGQGKGRGAHFRGELGPIGARDTTSRDRLRMLLSEVLVASALGKPAGTATALELRRLAVQNAEGDWDASALAAVAYLAEHDDDLAARSWLQVMLAGAGRYAEAVALPMSFPSGRPPAPAYSVVISALYELGRVDEARTLMTSLAERFPGLRDEFVTIWDSTAEGAAFSRLVGPSAQDQGLPTFFHLPFCGGTSTIVALKRAVPWAARIEIGRRYGLFQIERALAMPAEDAAKIKLVHLHHPYALQIAGRKLSYFTVLRDPVSQLASGYYKRRESTKIVPTRDTKEHRSATFEAHADYTISEGLTNMLARQLITTHPALAEAYERQFRGSGAFHTTGIEEDMFWFAATAQFPPETLLRMARETLSERFHLVGTMRHLAASHLAGAASIGLPVAERIGHRGKSSQPKSGISPALEERLREANSVDQLLYDEYTERFERDHAELITAVEGGRPSVPARAPATHRNRAMSAPEDPAILGG